MSIGVGPSADGAAIMPPAAASTSVGPPPVVMLAATSSSTKTLLPVPTNRVRVLLAALTANTYLPTPSTGVRAVIRYKSRHRVGINAAVIETLCCRDSCVCCMS